MDENNTNKFCVVESRGLNKQHCQERVRRENVLTTCKVFILGENIVHDLVWVIAAS